MTSKNKKLATQVNNFQAKQKRIAHRFSLDRYAIFHWQALGLSFDQLRKNLVASCMTIAVIGIALALPAVFFVLLQNADFVGKSLEKGTQISIFLNPSKTTSASTDDLMAKIQAVPDVASVNYISPEKGLKELETQEGLSGVLEQLPFNPLPAVIEVYPSPHVTTPEQTQRLLNTLEQMPGVDSVKLDMLWVKRLHAIVNVGKSIVYALGTLLGLAVILVVNHTIQLSTQNRHAEINVLNLIGATRGFIRRPFLYTGVLYGSFGGFFAWIFVEFFILFLSFPVDHLAGFYHTHFELHGLGFLGGFNLILLGLLLGLLGSWSAVSRSMKEISAL